MHLRWQSLFRQRKRRRVQRGLQQTIIMQLTPLLDTIITVIHSPRSKYLKWTEQNSAAERPSWRWDVSLVTSNNSKQLQAKIGRGRSLSHHDIARYALLRLPVSLSQHTFEATVTTHIWHDCKWPTKPCCYQIGISSTSSLCKHGW